MLICAGGIQDTTKEYADAKKLEKDGRFMSLAEYRKFVRKTVSQFGKKYGFIRDIVLESDELISEIMTEVMRADWTFNGDKSSLNTYRVNNVKWQMGDIVCRIKTQYAKNNKLKQKYSCSQQQKNEESPEIQHIIDKDEKKFLLSQIEKALPKIKPQEQEFIRAHYLNGMPVKEVAKHFNKSIPYVYTVISNGVAALKEHINVVQ